MAGAVCVNDLQHVYGTLSDSTRCHNVMLFDRWQGMHPLRSLVTSVLGHFGPQSLRSLGFLVLCPVKTKELVKTRRPASADRTARRQFQAIGQPVSRTQANDTMTSPLPRYEAKCVQRRCFQCESVPLRSDIKGTELPPASILIPLERQLIALQLCR